MSQWTITSLRVGELYLPEGSGVMRDPIHCWLVRGAGHNILVDSGMTDIATIRDRLKVDGIGGGHSALTECLAAEGLAPVDIDHVVLTHLHFDHADNLDLFPDGVVVIQRDELQEALDPVPSQRIFYWQSTITNLTNRKRGRQIRMIDGDLDLFPGFKLLKLPAHTAGMQIPIVDTTKGKVALVSDLGDHYRYWFPADPRATDRPKRFLSGDYLTGNIRSESERTWQQAMRRVANESDIVVPAHDFRIPMQIPDQWWDCPESTEGDLAHVPPQQVAA